MRNDVKSSQNSKSAAHLGARPQRTSELPGGGAPFESVGAKLKTLNPNNAKSIIQLHQVAGADAINDRASLDDDGVAGPEPSIDEAGQENAYDSLVKSYKLDARANNMILATDTLAAFTFTSLRLSL